VLLLVVVVLLAPVLAPLRSSLLPLLSRASIAGYVVMLLSCALLLSASMEWRRYRQLLTSASSTHSGSDYLVHTARQAEAERDCVLSLAALLLLLGIAAVYRLVKDQLSLRNKFIAMEKQARGASAAFMNSITPATASASSVAPSAAAATSGAASPSSSSQSSSALQQRVDALMADKLQLEKRLHAMERQARSASDAFLASDSTRSRDVTQQLEVTKAELKAVKEQNTTLKDKLEEFELVLGPAKKKKI